MIGLDVAPGADTTVVGSVADRAPVDRELGFHCATDYAAVLQAMAQGAALRYWRPS